MKSHNIKYDRIKETYINKCKCPTLSTNWKRIKLDHKAKYKSMLHTKTHLNWLRKTGNQMVAKDIPSQCKQINKQPEWKSGQKLLNKKTW